MLEKPDIADALILARLEAEFGLRAAEIIFLPLGADLNTSVYRAVTQEGAAYFLKLRSGAFDEVTLAVPRLLQEAGVEAIIAPLETRAGRLWGELDDFKLFLYPFVEGKDGYEVSMSERQWELFGAALKGVHSARVPLELSRRIPREAYSAYWRDRVRMFQAQAEEDAYEEPAARRLAEIMRSQRGEIARVVEKAGALAGLLLETPREMGLCHADIHPGNLLIGKNDGLHIVDWDTLAIAPKERDLMFAGAEGSRERELFMRGYGPAQVDRVALAYYHYARIVEDLAVTGEQLFLSSEGGDDRLQAIEYFESNFRPENTIARADRAFEAISGP